MKEVSCLYCSLFNSEPDFGLGFCIKDLRYIYEKEDVINGCVDCDFEREPSEYDRYIFGFYEY